jgi:hypothetical protein
LVTDESMALAMIEPGGIEYDPQAADYVNALHVVAVDATTGTRLWDADRLWPVTIAHDTVLAQVGGVPFSLSFTGQQAEAPAVVALDAATGETRWDLSERYSWSDLVLTAGDVAVIKVAPLPDDGQSEREGDTPRRAVTETLVVDLATGREIASFGTEVFTCGTDGSELIACSMFGRSDDRRLATFRVAGRDAGVSAAGLPDLDVDGVWQGRVFGSALESPPPDPPYRTEWTPVERYLSVDRSGGIVEQGLPGSFLVGSDDYVIFRCGSIGTACPGEAHRDRTTDLYTVYRVRP